MGEDREKRNTMGESSDLSNAAQKVRVHTVIVGTLYKHYKGGIYQVIDKVVDSEEAGETTIIYQDTITKQKYSRPFKNWFTKVQTESGIVERFTEHNSREEENNPLAGFLIDMGLIPLSNKTNSKESFTEWLDKKGYDIVKDKKLNTKLKEEQKRLEDTLQKRREEAENFQYYVPSKKILAKKVADADLEGVILNEFGDNLFYLVGPRKKDGKVINFEAAVGDYIIQGDGWINVVDKEKFEKKYKLEMPSNGH